MTIESGLLSIIFRMAALFKSPKDRIERNFAYNRALEHSMSESINGQRIGRVADFRYGLCRYANVGCEIIAAYNALCLLGHRASLRPTISDLSYRFETCGGQMLFGRVGHKPVCNRKGNEGI